MAEAMVESRVIPDRDAVLAAGGFSREDTRAWLAALDGVDLPAAPDPARLDGDAAHVGPVCARGWDLLTRLPLRSHRTNAERRAGEAVVRLVSELCWRFCRAHRSALYSAATRGFTRHLRVDELVWRAAELWPGLLPSRAEVADELERLHVDKDGREVNQAMFIAQMLSGRDTGTHLVLAMLRPTRTALERLDEFVATGALDLGTARVEARGEAGWILFKHPRTLNAEDDQTMDACETAADLVLLHPGLRIGVLRGEAVDHPRYKGRRIFSSGLNLTRLYHGKLPFLFYLVRDMGWVNKMYRGLVGEDYRLDEPEDTIEKPWVAVVDGFAIGGGCQLLLVMDYVLAEAGAYFNLPARKEGIIPGCANLRLPRFMGERLARQAILFDKTFYVESPEARTLVNEVHPRDRLDEAADRLIGNALSNGMVSAGANRKALRLRTEPLDTFRQFMAVNAREQVFCHLSEQLTRNLEKNWQAKDRKL